MKNDDGYQVGPFLCDRCGVTLRDPRVVLSEGSLVIAAGFCPRHGGIWSKPVALPPLPVSTNRQGRDQKGRCQPS